MSLSVQGSPRALHLIKPSFLISLICTTRRRILTSASTNYGPEKWCFPGDCCVRACVSVLQQRVVRERTLGPSCPQTPQGVLVRGHAGRVINKLSSCVQGSALTLRPRRTITLSDQKTYSIREGFSSTDPAGKKTHPPRTLQ